MFRLVPPKALSRSAPQLRAALRLTLGAVCLLHCGGESVLGELGGVGGMGGAEPREESCAFVEYDLSEPPKSSELTFATFWEQGADREGVKVLSVRSEEGPFELVPKFDLGRSEQQDDLNSQLTNDFETVPDVFQVNGGADVLQWLESPDGGAQVCGLGGLDEKGFRDRYFNSALDPVTCRGELYALPIGIHRVNELYYSEDRLVEIEQALGSDRSPADVLDSFRTVEDFASYLEEVGSLGLSMSGGDALVPLAIGNAQGWPLGILAFDNLMASIDGLYEAVWIGQAAGDLAHEISPGVSFGEGLSRWLSLVQRLVAQSELGQELSWRQALSAVVRGDAVFSIMGDWGIAEVGLAEPQDRVHSVVFPPTRNTFLYTPDSIAVPRTRTADGQAARYFLKEVADHKRTQLRFARAKSAIPPRSDLTASDLRELADERLIETYHRFSRCDSGEDDCRLLLAVSGYDPPPFRDACFDETWELLARNAWGLAGAEHPAASRAAVESGVGGALQGRTAGCAEPSPSEPSAAGKELLSRLAELSARQPYAPSCWK